MNKLKIINLYFPSLKTNNYCAIKNYLALSVLVFAKFNYQKNHIEIEENGNSMDQIVIKQLSSFI